MYKEGRLSWSDSVAIRTRDCVVSDAETVAMSSAFRLFVKGLLVKSLLVLTWACSSQVTAGGGNNSTTSPAPAIMQWASFLSHVSSGNSHQGSVHSHSRGNSSQASAINNPKKSGCCQKLSRELAYHRRQGLAASRRPSGATAVRAVRPYRAKGHDRLAVRTDRQKTDSRDRFRNEAWFVQDGTSQRRVTKLQARKRGWTGPDAIQAVGQSRLAVAPAVAASDRLLAEKSRLSVAENEQGRVREPASRPAAGRQAMDCPECDAVEPGLCEARGKSSVPFRMAPHQGIVAFPRFEPDGASAIAAPDAGLRVLVKKFRTIQGTLQPDKSFSDEGVADLLVPLPVGDRVTDWTLAKDRLVVLSRPDSQQEGLSRVTIMRLDPAGEVARPDGGASSGLWVKGSLLRYYKDRLYTVSAQDRKIFVYTRPESESTRSVTPIRVFDLSSSDFDNSEPVSALAAGEGCYLAVRQFDTEAGDWEIRVVHVDESGVTDRVTKGARHLDGSQYQLHCQQGQVVLIKTAFHDAGLRALACLDPVGGPLEEESARVVHKRDEIREASGSGTTPPHPLENRDSMPCPGANKSYLFECTNRQFTECEQDCSTNPEGSRGCHTTVSGECTNPDSEESCSFDISWVTRDQPWFCGGYGSIKCPSCTASFSYGAYGFSPHCSGTADHPAMTVDCHPEGCIPGCQSGLSQRLPDEDTLNGIMGAASGGVIVVSCIGMVAVCLICQYRERAGYSRLPSSTTDPADSPPTAVAPQVIQA